MTAAEYLKENSDWFDKSPGGEKLYFESEVIKMMKNYSSQTEVSDDEIAIKFAEWIRIKDFQTTAKDNWIGLDMQYYTTKELYAKWYREQLKQNK
jgi:hypothetical protein